MDQFAESRRLVAADSVAFRDMGRKWKNYFTTELQNNVCGIIPTQHGRRLYKELVTSVQKAAELKLQISLKGDVDD